MNTRTYLDLLFPLLLFACLLSMLWGGFTDDGYIHIQYANNIITRGEYSFNPGEVSYGTTSPLWVLVHAAVGKMFGGGEGLIWISRVLSWVAGLLAVCFIFVLARTLGIRSRTAYLCAVAFAAHAWMVRWAALGMETSAAVLAIVAVGIASVDAYRKPRNAWLLGFFMATAALLRPEAYLLLPVYVVAAAFAGRETNWRCVARTILMFAVLLGPWLAFAKLHIGRFLPNTAGAKSGGLILQPMVFLHKLTPIVKIVGSAEGLVALLVVLSVVLLRQRSRMFSPGFRFLLLWVVALPVAYVVFDIQVLSRYMLLTSPFTIVLGFATLEQLMDRFNAGERALRWIPAAVAAVAVVLNVAFYVSVVLPPSRAFSRDLTHELKELALFIDANSAPDAIVAAADIGYLSFYSRRHVLDLGGLVDNVTHRLREQNTYEEIVEKGLFLILPEYPRVDYFIDRVKMPNRLDGKLLHGYRFESIRVDVIENLGIRKPGPFYYTLYRLHADGNG